MCKWQLFTKKAVSAAMQKLPCAIFLALYHEADKALHGLVYRGSSDGVLSGSLLIGESDCSASAATAREQRSHRLLRRLQPHQTPARAGLKPQAYVDAGH